MFDSDQIFVVCVEPPTQSSEGQLRRIDTYQFLRDENDDKWARRLMSNGLVFRGRWHYIPKGTCAQVQQHIYLLAFQIS